MRSGWASIALGLGLLLASAAPAEAQVSGRQLLSWCEGALGGSATAAFDAFQCEAYLQAVLDREAADGTGLAECLGTARPTAGDLMARIVPVLRGTGDGGDGGLSAAASGIVGRWIRANCDPADTPDPPLEETEPATAPPDAAPDPLIELAIWQGTQRIERPAARIDALEHYLEDYPDGRFADLARLQLEDLQAALADEPPSDAPNTAATEPPAEPVQAATPPAAPESPPPRAVAATPPPQPPPAAETAPSRFEDTLTAADRRLIQEALRDLGLYQLAIDGVFGNGTRRAIRIFQDVLGVPQTGYLTEDEAGVLVALAFEEPARQDPAPRITVYNAGNSAITAIYASPTSSTVWESNHLGGSLLLPGMEYALSLPDRDTCHYDVMVVDEKNMSREYWSLDACGQLWLSFPQ